MELARIKIINDKIRDYIRKGIIKGFSVAQKGNKILSIMPFYADPTKEQRRQNDRKRNN